jgi:hypothetical protein
MVEEKREETRFVQRTSGLSCQTLTPEHHQQTHRRDMHHHITLSTDISVKLPSDRKRPVGVNLVPKGGTNTTVLFSSEGAKNQRAPSEGYTFFHYC